MKYKIVNVRNHLILHTVICDDLDLLNTAASQAAYKAATIRHEDTAGRIRDQAEIESQNFLGTLADLVCARILMAYFDKHSLPIRVDRYDDVRTDGFVYPDQYDLKLICENREYLVEVRSSSCIYIALEKMIETWQILGPYSTQIKGKTETEKAFYLRPLFHLTTFRKNRSTQEYQRVGAFDAIRSGALELYFVGGATLEMMLANGRDEGGQELKQNNARFLVLDIMEGLDAKNILEVIASQVMLK